MLPAANNISMSNVLIPVPSVLFASVEVEGGGGIDGGGEGGEGSPGGGGIEGGGDGGEGSPGGGGIDGGGKGGEGSPGGEGGEGGDSIIEFTFTGKVEYCQVPAVVPSPSWP